MTTAPQEEPLRERFASGVFRTVGAVCAPIGKAIDQYLEFWEDRIIAPVASALHRWVGDSKFRQLVSLPLVFVPVLLACVGVALPMAVYGLTIYGATAVAHFIF